jgi:magnesium transporter
MLTLGLRDMTESVLSTYLSSVSNRMNEVMKVLTIIATIFIPLTFITGIYGMNFTNMRELEWRYGYFIILIVMAVIGISLVVYFRRRRWL